MKENISQIIPGVLKRGLDVFIVFSFAILVLGMVGCKGPLEVDNPNSVPEENLNDPAAANSIANGAWSTAARGVGYSLAPYSTATDEGTWRGSRDGWNQLDRGNIADFNNEFIDAAWPFITEARFTADEAIRRLTEFRNAGQLKDRDPKNLNLTKSYLYGAWVRLTIGDMFDDFVYSNRTEAAPPIGETNMFRIYDEAIAYADSAFAIAKAASDAELQRRALGLRARARHAKAVWQLLNPRPITQPLSNPFVNAGAEDATAALAMMSVTYRWRYEYKPEQSFYNEWSFEVNSRSELNTAAPAKDIIEVTKDDPRIVAEITDFKDKATYRGDRYSPLTIISEREMQLILAESKVVSDAAGATSILNALRARDGLKPLAAPVTVGELLIHERRAILFMMGRRLADMYRFNIKATQWVAASDAVTKPGSFFPITIAERRSNPFLTGGR